MRNDSPLFNYSGHIKLSACRSNINDRFPSTYQGKKSLLAIAHASAHRVYLLYPPLKGTYTECLEKCIEFISSLTHHLS